MKTHKIKNIEKSVCTLEQKIAYNIAFRIYINYYDETKFKNSPQFVKSEFVHDKIRYYINLFKELYGDKKYNLDVIFHCLNIGLQNYLENNKYVFSNYEDIGKAFPILYPIE